MKESMSILGGFGIFSLLCLFLSGIAFSEDQTDQTAPMDNQTNITAVMQENASGNLTVAFNESKILDVNSTNNQTNVSNETQSNANAKLSAAILQGPPETSGPNDAGFGGYMGLGFYPGYIECLGESLPTLQAQRLITQNAEAWVKSNFATNELGVMGDERAEWPDMIIGLSQKNHEIILWNKGPRRVVSRLMFATTIGSGARMRFEPFVQLPPLASSSDIQPIETNQVLLWKLPAVTRDARHNEPGTMEFYPGEIIALTQWTERYAVYEVPETDY